MLFCKCLETMLQRSNNDQKQQCDKSDKIRQNIKTDKQPMSDVDQCEDNKVVANLSTISFILKDLTDGSRILNNLEESHLDNCPVCQTTKEEYKVDIKYFSVLEKIINSVIQKEVTELLEGVHEDGNKSPLQQTQYNRLHKKDGNETSIISNPEQHSLRCLLIHLQRALGELILQICFSLSRKTKSEKLNRLSKLNMADITLLELRTLNYQFSALTDYIIYMFKDSKNLGGPQKIPKIETPHKQIINLKQKINDSINMITSSLNSVKKVHLQQYENKPLSTMTNGGKCCNRMYPHIHCNMSGNNFIMKYVKSKGNKHVADKSDSCGKSKHSSRRHSESPAEDSTAVKSHSLGMSNNSLSALSLHILHDKLLNILDDSAELQKKVNEILKNKIKIIEIKGAGMSDKSKHNDGKDKSNVMKIKTSSDTKSISRKELENAVNDIILDACNIYSRTSQKDLKRSLNNAVDDSKTMSIQKQTDYLVNHAHLSPKIYSNLLSNDNLNNKCKVNVSSETVLIKRRKLLQLGDTSTSREYLPYSVSLESLPLSPEETEELTLKLRKDETIPTGKYRYENLSANNIFSMDIRQLSDLINDDKCECDPYATANPSATPYSPSLTSLPLTNEELDELVIKLNKSKYVNKDQHNNKNNNKTHMQIMYFKTDINPNLILKNRRRLSYCANVKIKRSLNTMANRAMKTNDKNSKDSDKSSLNMVNNLPHSITPPLRTNKTYQARRNKSLEKYKINGSKSIDFDDIGQFQNILQKRLFTKKKQTDLEILNAKIKHSTHNLKPRVHSRRLSLHKGISVTDEDGNSVSRGLKNMSKVNNKFKRFLTRNIGTRPVENNANRLSTKSININKSKSKINSNGNVLRKREQKARINRNAIKMQNRIKTQDKNSVRRCVTIHHSTNNLHYTVLKLISLNQQNCFLMKKSEFSALLYKRLINIGCKQENYLKLNHIICSKKVQPKSIKQHNVNTISAFSIEMYIPQIIVLEHVKIICTVMYAEYKNNLYFSKDKEKSMLTELKIKAKRPVVLCAKKRSFKKIHKICGKKSVEVRNWCGDTRNLGKYSFSELDITDLDSKLTHYMYLTLDKCLSLLNNNIKYKNKTKKDAMFKNISTQESAQEFLNDITKFLKNNKQKTVSKKQVLSQIFNICSTVSNEENTKLFKHHTQKQNVVSVNSIQNASFHNIHKEPLYLFDVLGRPLTDNSGHVLKSRKGEALIKFNDLGEPISDTYGGPVFDANGLQPSEGEFNATRTPCKVKSMPLVNVIHKPMKIYDCNGRPLTSANGIPLANSTGEIMLKFDSQGHPISDIFGKPIYISNCT